MRAMRCVILEETVLQIFGYKINEFIHVFVCKNYIQEWKIKVLFFNWLILVWNYDALILAYNYNNLI